RQSFPSERHVWIERHNAGEAYESGCLWHERNHVSERLIIAHHHVQCWGCLVSWCRDAEPVLAVRDPTPVGGSSPDHHKDGEQAKHKGDLPSVSKHPIQTQEQDQTGQQFKRKSVSLVSKLFQPDRVRRYEEQAVEPELA